MAVRPNFFLIGAPKSGTSAVAKALGNHPDIFMSEPKEPFFFMFTQGNPYGFEHRDTSALGTYLRLFEAGAGKPVIGEATTVYMHAPYVAGEIRKLCPDARIMAMLRNPVERAYSMYLYWHQQDIAVPTPERFREEFFNGALTHIPKSSAVNPRMLEFLKSFGFYHEQLKHYYAVFPRDRILVMSYDDLTSDQARFMRCVLSFLQVDTSQVPFVPQENVTIEPWSRRLHYWLNVDSVPRRLMKRMIGSSPTLRSLLDLVGRVNTRKVPAAEFLPDALYRELTDVYRDDVLALSALVGEDFTSWLDKQPVFLGRAALAVPSARKAATY